MITQSGGRLPQDRPDRHVPGLKAALWRWLGRRFKRADWYFRGQNQMVYYLGPGGDDANDGLSWPTRKATIAAVEELVDAGDIVYVGSSDDVGHDCFGPGR